MPQSPSSVYVDSENGNEQASPVCCEINKWRERKEHQTTEWFQIFHKMSRYIYMWRWFDDGVGEKEEGIIGWNLKTHDKRIITFV